MLLKECSRCKRYIPYGKIYCEACKIIVEKEKEQQKAEWKKNYDKKYDLSRRNKQSQMFYRSKAWRLTKERYLLLHNYKCERCGKIATQVHHKEYIDTASGWGRRLDTTNLECLCLTCHNAEHKRFTRRGG